jgi:hypothetical protein
MHPGKQKFFAVLAMGALLASCADPYRPYETLNYDECYSAPPGYVIDREKYSPVPECWVFNTRRPVPKTALTGGGAGGVGAGSPGHPTPPSNPGTPKPAEETPEFSSTVDGGLAAEGKEIVATGDALGPDRGAYASDGVNTSDTTGGFTKEARDFIDSLKPGAEN